MKRGFTLIELLVVVLIIGILAAIALPQYQRAVERARMAEGIQTLGSITKAQTIYYMQQGNFAADLDTLNRVGDITIPTPGDAWRLGTFGIIINQEYGSVRTVTLTRANGKYQGGILRENVFPDGSIVKECVNPSGTTDFCTMAQNAGYEEVTL